MNYETVKKIATAMWTLFLVIFSLFYATAATRSVQPDITGIVEQLKALKGEVEALREFQDDINKVIEIADDWNLSSKIRFASNGVELIPKVRGKSMFKVYTSGQLLAKRDTEEAGQNLVLITTPEAPRIYLKRSDDGFTNVQEVSR